MIYNNIMNKNKETIWIFFKELDDYNSVPRAKTWWRNKPSPIEIQEMFSKKCNRSFISDIINDRISTYNGYNYWIEESIEGDYI